MKQAHFSSADLYAAGLSDSEVTGLLGADWWPEPPTFAVPPLDAASTPADLLFAIHQQFGHVGTQEGLGIRYSAYDKSSSAITRITALENALGTSLTGPTIGDQRDYYATKLPSGAAPYRTYAFVRVGAVNVTVTYDRKDRFATTSESAKIASKAVAHLRDLNAGKLKATPLAQADKDLLPPPGPLVTLLGETVLDVRAFPVLYTSDDPQSIVGELKNTGVARLIYSTYVLDADTHMEVRAALLKFDTASDALSWVSTFVGPAEASKGPIAAHYDSVAGVTLAVMSQGRYGGILVCRSTVEGEASSRSCDDPLPRAAVAWQQALPTS